MKQTLDYRGKACPIPVIETKKALELLSPGDQVEVLVDNSVAVQNLTKLAAQKKLTSVTETKETNLFLVTLTLTEELQPEEAASADFDCSPKNEVGNTVVVLSSDKMGEGDEKLGHILMKGFIYALTELEKLPETVIIYNSGVKLAALGSDSLADLKLLQSQGVEILACGTCLNHYQLTEQLGVGSVTNMYTIVEKLSEARKVMKP